MTTLEDLLCPRSIAIVGASDDPTRIGGRPLSHMINQRFDGAVYPVNPKRETVQGLPAYPTLAEVPGEVDFVLVAVPAAGVAEVVRQAAEKHARTVLIFSSGFAEMGGDGIAMQAELSRLARETGVRVIGPNCLGAFNSATRFYPTFTSTIDRATPVPGGISIASQSGAYGSHIYMVSHLRGLGIRYWLTTGNEADLHIAECIRLLAENDDVHTIMAYAESVKDGPMLSEALETARAARKPVIFMKVGRSAVGAAAASSHTASLAGEDAIYDAVLRSHGAWRARSTEEMLDIAYACRPRIYPAGRRLGLVTISGGAGVLMADAAEDAGLDVAPMPADAQAEIKQVVPFASALNPVDVTAQFFNDLSLVPRFTKAMLERGGYDGLIGFWTSVAGSPVLATPLLKSLTQAMKGREDQIFLQSVVAPDEIRKAYEDAGFPCFEDPTRAVNAMAALMAFGIAFEKGRADMPEAPALPPLPDGPMGEREAKRLLAEAGLPVVEDRLVRSAEEAAEAAREFGRSAFKIASPDILHKTEAGGVRLGVTADDAAAAFERIMASARAHDSKARLDGVLVSPMIEGGVEMILGARIDPVFGPVVMAGLGGVFTEIFRDVSFRRAPVSADTAMEMLDELKGSALLKGARGQPAADARSLAQALSQLSIFAAAHANTLESVEMNPVRALPDGAVALDALIVTRKDRAS
ncbi:acetate--CoA ligase family protein [Limibaculum sp. M0105]|uniref:Acetate--CoA ligase family protein n=1 Tax=Thermohalobaculum xanthum TaxID=2753746 RepID=A0A8J7SF90_9RHOB|nr:acetate--CoA ligase family protein [Thermohalobaculum xanthum]MBK0400258.1 acetate--CoA ligase family protein [Thermohalobaculum xanthum]